MSSRAENIPTRVRARWLALAGRAAVGLALLAAILLLRPLDWHALGRTLRRTDPLLLALAAAGFLPLMASKSWRWLLLLRRAGLACGFGRAFRLYLAAFALGLVTPGRLGELARAHQLARELGVSWTACFRSVISNRLFDLVFLLAFAPVGLWVIWGTNPHPAISLLGFALVNLSALFALAAAGYWLFGNAPGRCANPSESGAPAPHPESEERKRDVQNPASSDLSIGAQLTGHPCGVRRVLSGISSLNRPPLAGFKGRFRHSAFGLRISALADGRRSVRYGLTWLGLISSDLGGPTGLAAAAITWLSYAIFFGASYLLFRALGLPLGWFTSAAVLAGLSLMLLLPISIAGVGTREATLIFLLSRFGCSREDALAASLLQLAVFTVFGGLVGALALVAGGRALPPISAPPLEPAEPARSQSFPI